MHKRKTAKIPCEICAEMVSRAQMSSHRLLKHTDIKNMPFICPTCGKGWRSRSHLDKHMFTHTGAKPHACDQCGASFGEKSNLLAHKKGVHLGIKRTPREPKVSSKTLDALL